MDYLNYFWDPPTPPIIKKDALTFYIHDIPHSVDTNNFSPNTSLNYYIRNVAHLTGTKNMCFEGGCGSCVVTVCFKDPLNEKHVTLAVNSCLVSIFSCAGWQIYTVEKIGDSTGYHPAQKALVQFSGTQCGYCSSGMIMNMYALYESSSPTMEQVENSFGGNICRCTGYRPILTAFKSLATDASKELLGSYCDIEDIPTCKKDPKLCKTACPKILNADSVAHFYAVKTAVWYKAYSISEIFDVIKIYQDKSYRLVAGNTASGVYKPKNVDVYIEITSVKDLLVHSIDDKQLILGANITLTNTITLFNKLSEKTGFSYLKILAEHINLVANVPVRNLGTLAGNLITKHEHHEFPSDIFLILECVGATLTIVDTSKKEMTKSLMEFINMDMTGKLIKQIKLVSLQSNYAFNSYKIMPRAQNALALVNAAFLLKLNQSEEVISARIVYGAMNPDFVHANKTERYLLAKKLFSDDVLQGAFKLLDEEIRPDYVLPNPSPKFRKQLAISLFYKYILGMAPTQNTSPRNKSGALKQKRPISSGTQDFETNESLYPLTQPIPKVEALAQCAGTAEYIMDMPDRPNQLYAALVLAKAPPYSIITNINASKALKMEGVTSFYDKSHIPGVNDFTPKASGVDYTTPEELFCSGEVKYYYQPVGMIVATSQVIAEEAVEMVEIKYSNSTKKPLLTIKDILASDAPNKLKKVVEHKPTSRGNDVKHVLKGTMNLSFQYHYHLETQCCVAIPEEDGISLYTSTHDINLAQGSAAKVLDIPINKINVFVRRLGGSYGGKISRNALVSSAAALATYKLKKPVKMSMSLVTNMNAVGKRHPLYATYEVGVNESGVIQHLNSSIYSDMGSFGGNENPITYMTDALFETYNSDIWNVDLYNTFTDTATSTWTRGPGRIEPISYQGNLMQQIAVDLNLDPIDVHIKNLNPKYAPLAKYLKDLVEWAEIKSRREQVKEFNKKNRWIKKGIGIMPWHFPTIPFGDWNALISIHQGDGSVSLCHGGIEMGQGINTKAAQMCAHVLGISVDQVIVKPTQSLISPNPGFTGASITSEGVCYAVLKIAEILKERMQPIKEKMGNPTWKDLVRKCYEDHVELTATYMFTILQAESYSIYAAACAEVELDVLTGQTRVDRVDIIEEVGSSLNPIIDIGQVEGGFVMGMGFWTSEEVIFNHEGRLLTNNTWTYTPPGAQDIPVDFRIKFPKNNPNDKTIVGAKATGEPPLCMAMSVAFAIKDAVATARIESSPTVKKWYPIDGPCTVENTFLNCLNDYKQYKL